MASDFHKELLKLALAKKKLTKNSSVSSSTNNETPKLRSEHLKRLKDKITEETHQQDIKDKESDRTLKRTYAKWLYSLLVGEIIFIFLIVILDGFKPFGFTINEWLLASIFNAIILQSFFLVRLVTESLFSNNKH